MDGPLVYVSGYSEPMGHIRGDQLLDGIRTFRLQPDGTLGVRPFRCHLLCC